LAAMVWAQRYTLISNLVAHQFAPWILLLDKYFRCLITQVFGDLSVMRWGEQGLEAAAKAGAFEPFPPEEFGVTHTSDF
jgi:hypothetical protein